MKKILYFLLLIPIATQAQKVPALDTLPTIDGMVNYTKVIRMDSVSKDELYKRAKLWLITTYRSAKDVIEIDDLNGGELVGKGVYNTYWKVIDMSPAEKVRITYLLKFDFKENKYRYQLTNILYSTGIIDGVPIDDMYKTKPANRLRYTVNEHFIALARSLEEGMAKPSGKDDNW